MQGIVNSLKTTVAHIHTEPNRENAPVIHIHVAFVKIHTFVNLDLIQSHHSA